MKKQTLYIESSVISYLTAKPSRDAVMNARQILTREWWEEELQVYDSYISHLVFTEVSKGDIDASKKRVEAIQDIMSLDITEEVYQLAYRIINTSFPEDSFDDAVHIAVSAINGMNYLLTWNFKHIANASLRKDIITACNDEGYECPIICSPAEFLGGK